MAPQLCNHVPFHITVPMVIPLAINTKFPMKKALQYACHEFTVAECFEFMVKRSSKTCYEIERIEWLEQTSETLGVAVSMYCLQEQQTLMLWQNRGHKWIQHIEKVHKYLCMAF